MRISKDIPVELYKPYTQHFIGSFLENNKVDIANKKYEMNDFKKQYDDTVSTMKLSDVERDELWGLVFADKTLDEKKLRYVKLVVYNIHDKTYKLNYIRQLANTCSNTAPATGTKPPAETPAEATATVKEYENKPEEP